VVTRLAPQAGGHKIYFDLTGNSGEIPADDPPTEVWISNNNNKVWESREREPAHRPRFRDRLRHRNRS